jgi:putative ATPase
MKSLFGDGPASLPFASLAGRLWPESVDGPKGFFGQDSSREGVLLRHVLKTGFLRSMVLYGPPGCGKSAFTRLLFKLHDIRQTTLRGSETSSSEIRQSIDRAKGDRKAGARHILVVEEIDRLGKTQQDLLIAPVDEGDVVLIGLSNENPLRTFLPALASRVLSIRFHALSHQEIARILDRALSFLSDQAALPIRMGDGGRKILIERSGGDARRMLGALEWAFDMDRAGSSGKEILIRESSILEGIGQSGGLYFDRENHFDLISAFIKSVRNHDPDGALHWLARMIESGEDPLYVSRRLIILAAEDIGLADPFALTLATSCLSAVSAVGLPEARIILSETTIYLAMSPKSNSAYKAIDRAINAVRDGFLPPVPSHFKAQHRNTYLYPPDQPGGVSPQKSIPPGTSFYHAGPNGWESRLINAGDGEGMGEEKNDLPQRDIGPETLLD